MNPGIFREYDIRGLVDEDLTSEVVRALGQGFATYISNKGRRRVFVERDGRLSSPRFRDFLVEGMASGGLEGIDLGVCPGRFSIFLFSI